MSDNTKQMFPWAEQLKEAVLRGGVDIGGMPVNDAMLAVVERIASLTEQLAAARRDAKEAEACLEEGWKPIETAPRDGTSILVFTDRGVFEATFVSYWEFAVANYHGCLCCSGRGDNPTHWMPLPEPPKEKP